MTPLKAKHKPITRYGKPVIVDQKPVLKLVPCITRESGATVTKGRYSTKPLIIELYYGDVIGLRIKGTRQRKAITVDQLWFHLNESKFHHQLSTIKRKRK